MTSSNVTLTFGVILWAILIRMIIHIFRPSLVGKELKQTKSFSINQNCYALLTPSRGGVQGGKTFWASFCACLIAGSRRACLCVDRVRLFVCLSLREFWLRVNEIHKMWTFASREAFLLLCGFCFLSLENCFGLGTTKEKRIIPSVWGGIKSFEHFQRGEYFLIVHSIYLRVDFAFFRLVALPYLLNIFSHFFISTCKHVTFVLYFVYFKSVFSFIFVTW